MKTTKLLLILFITALMLYSCNDNSVNPDNLQPGRRDYVWTVDTLNYPYNPMYRMWGSSPTDIWTTSSGYHDKSISHFNGVNWTSYGVARMNVPYSIYGFSSNNVYVGSGGGGIWHYNGSTWTNVSNITKNGHSDIVFDNIWGDSPDDIYVTGAYPDEYGFNNSVIAHYSNLKWDMFNTNGLYGIVEHLYKNLEDSKIYLQVINLGGGRYFDSTLIYEYSNEKYKKIYSSIWTQGLQADISLINNEVYFILGNDIDIRINDNFQIVLKVNNPNFNQRIWGRNSKDIFLLMTDGLAHYNGNDVEYLFHFNLADVLPWTQIFGAALFEKEVFFLVYEPTTHLNLIYHGKLK